MNARAHSGNVERSRWILAELAEDAQEKNIPAWAEVIGNACRRSVSTVYEWRKAYVLRKSVKPASRLGISFWVTAANALTEDNYETILDWLKVAENDETMTLESACANLPRKPKPAPPPVTLRDELIQVDAALSDILSEYDGKLSDAMDFKVRGARDTIMSAVELAASETVATAPQAATEGQGDA